MTISIEGVSRIERMMKEYPKEMTTMIKKAMRREAPPHLARVEHSAPSQWRGELVIKAIVKEKNGVIMMSAGIFGVPRNDSEVPAFYKYLWQNYGTLYNRDSRHHFKNPVKPHNGYRRGGIEARHMFENAVSNAEQSIAAGVAKTIEDSVAKFEKEINR